MDTASGYSKNGLPYNRIGNGAKLLFYFPGLLFENKPATGMQLAYMASAMKFLSDVYTIYAVQRRPGLPQDASIESMAADYADMIREIADGPVVIFGSSTGGSIAQQFAADYPGLVEKLVLHSSASVLNPEARRLQLQVADLASSSKWREAYWRIMAVMLPKSVIGRALIAPLMWLGSMVAGSINTPKSAADLIATVRAEDKHDFAPRLSEITAPTLVIAGSEDPFYSRALFEQTAERIQDAKLVLYEGAGHGVSGSRYRKDLIDFLSS